MCDLDGLKFLYIAMSELARTKMDEVRGSEGDQEEIKG